MVRLRPSATSSGLSGSPQVSWKSNYTYLLVLLRYQQLFID